MAGQMDSMFFEQPRVSPWDVLWLAVLGAPPYLIAMIAFSLMGYGADVFVFLTKVSMNCCLHLPTSVTLETDGRHWRLARSERQPAIRWMYWTVAFVYSAPTRCVAAPFSLPCLMFAAAC